MTNKSSIQGKRLAINSDILRWNRSEWKSYQELENMFLQWKDILFEEKILI